MALGGEKDAALQYGDASRRRQLQPDVAAAQRPASQAASVLARDRDQAEIADRGAVRLRIPVQDDDALAARQFAFPATLGDQRVEDLAIQRTGGAVNCLSRISS